MKKIFHTTKALDMPVDDGLWAIATCEAVDTSGDVIMADGVDYSAYHNPPKSHLKILAGHTHMLADGTPAVVGRVEEFARSEILVEGISTPALLFRMSWAKDTDGNLTDLSSKYKKLFDAGYMDSFSVGLMVEAHKENKSGGIDITKSCLFEVSAVAVPALPYANAIKAIEETLDIKLTPAPILNEKEIVKAIKDTLEPYATADSVKALVTEELNKAVVAIAEQYKSLEEKLDCIDSALVVLTKNLTRSENDQKGSSESSIKEINSVLDRLNKYLT